MYLNRQKKINIQLKLENINLKEENSKRNKHRRSLTNGNINREDC